MLLLFVCEPAGIARPDIGGVTMTTASPFQPAVREAQKARVLLSGPSKSGKTLTALLLARGIVGEHGKIAVIDTEGGRSRLYAGEQLLVTPSQPAGFDVAEVGAPYHPASVKGAIDLAHQHGYDIVILDGISPYWEGPGGTQSIVDENTKPGGNKFTSGWSVATPEHQKMLAAVTHAPVHVICTCRAKHEYVMEQKDGKAVPRKVGLKPVQRDGIEYEFDIFAMLDPEHEATLEARGPFEGMHVVTPGKELGMQIGAWLGATFHASPNGATPAAQQAPPVPAQPDAPSVPPEPGPGSTPAPQPEAPQTPPQTPQTDEDPFASAAPPQPSPISPEQQERLAGYAAELAALSPDKGDVNTRMQKMQEKAREWFGKPIDGLAYDEALRMLESAEQAVAHYKEKAGRL
jgi:DNA polymerase III delta prime subunit